MRNRECFWSTFSLAAVAGLATAAGAAAPPMDSMQVHQAVPAPAYADDLVALEMANKLGLNRLPESGMRGLPVCPDILLNTSDCHSANLTLGANFSVAAASDFRTMDNFQPASSNPTRLCWIGRYANRVNPIANESFSVRIFADNNGFPNLAAGPIFDRVFSVNGTPGVNRLEMDCLDGESCPGTTDPVAGGHWVYSALVNDGYPLTGNSCYWLEVAVVGSAQGGCLSDWDNSGTVNSTDISAFITSWLDSVNNNNLNADFNGDLVVNSTDISAFITAWLSEIGQPCPAGVRWGWVGSQTGTDLTSLQAIDGAYTTFTRVANDRAFCFSGGVVGLESSCIIEPMPPVCTYDTANGIPQNGGLTNGFAASSPGSAAVPGVYTPFQRGENFQFATAQTVEGICFGGFWLGINHNGVAVGGIAAPSEPNFDVIYYATVDGFPGSDIPIAHFTTGQPGVVLQWDGGNVTNVQHPPVNFAADTCYVVSVGRVQPLPAQGAPAIPRWHWFLTFTSTPTGDNLVYSRNANGTPADWIRFDISSPSQGGNMWFLLSHGPTTAPVCEAPPCDPSEIPANDLCQNAIQLAVPSTVNGTTICATDTGQPATPCPGADANSSGGVWYRVIGTGGLMTASTCAALNYDGQLSVFSGSCGALNCIVGGDDTCIPGQFGIMATVDWQSTAGVEYFILVHGWGGEQGPFILSVSSQ